MTNSDSGELAEALHALVLDAGLIDEELQTGQSLVARLPHIPPVRQPPRSS